MGTPKTGESDGDRTHDLLVKSQLLYQLSYRPDCCRDYSVIVNAKKNPVNVIFQSRTFFLHTQYSILLIHNFIFYLSGLTQTSIDLDQSPSYQDLGILKKITSPNRLANPYLKMVVPMAFRSVAARTTRSAMAISALLL